MPPVRTRIRPARPDLGRPGSSRGRPHAGTRRQHRVTVTEATAPQPRQGPNRAPPKSTRRKASASTATASRPDEDATVPQRQRPPAETITTSTHTDPGEATAKAMETMAEQIQLLRQSNELLIAQLAALQQQRSPALQPAAEMAAEAAITGNLETITGELVYK